MVTSRDAERRSGGRARAGRRSWDTFGRARTGQRLLVCLGVLFLLPGLLATYLRLVPPTDDAPALVASFISYGVLAYLLALLFFVTSAVRARRGKSQPLLAGASALLLSCHLFWIAPLFVPDRRPATTATITLMSLNMEHGNANAGSMTRAAAQADVVVLLETTPAALAGLKAYGWDQRFPYSVGQFDFNVSDSAVFSRFPMSGKLPAVGTSYFQWMTNIRLPVIGQVHLIPAHPCNPYCGGRRWAAEHAYLRAAADANLGGPLILAGDFNAVDDHGPIRQLVGDGFESATDIVGAGWLPTYPANRWFPPLLPIDHIFVNQSLTVTTIKTVKVAGTDHLGLLATIAGTG